MAPVGNIVYKETCMSESCDEKVHTAYYILHCKKVITSYFKKKPNQE